MDFRDKLILAPMAGVCDQPFRLLCKEQGCDILYSEMVSAKAIYYKNKNTKPLLAMDEREKPFGLQLFGSDPEIMAEMAKNRDAVAVALVPGALVPEARALRGLHIGDDGCKIHTIFPLPVAAPAGVRFQNGAWLRARAAALPAVPARSMSCCASSQRLSAERARPLPAVRPAPH